MIAGCNHITLSASDLELSFNFYKDILGFKPLCRWDRGAYFLAGELWFCLNASMDCIPAQDLTHIAFTVEEQDFHKIEAKICQAEAVIYQDNVSDGLSLYFLDPAGHKLEIHVGEYKNRIKSKKQNAGTWKNIEFFETTSIPSNQNIPHHTTAKPSHYDEAAETYDLFNEEKSKQINDMIAELLRAHQVHTVGDFTCGTGSQLLCLHNKGFTVSGSDINSAMLAVARRKLPPTVKLMEADMISVQLGYFDAIITIHSAIGHLTKPDFSLALHNINQQLAADGLYVFDIFNLDYLMHGDNIAKLTIDWLEKDKDGKMSRYIQYSTIDEQGLLASYTTAINGTKTTQSLQTLQVYRVEEINTMLKLAGFSILEVYGIDRLNIAGSEFIAHTSERMLVIAQKNY